MGFTESLIAIIDKISSQVGIVVDWTADNVVPYVMELCNRIVMYEGIKAALGIVICLIVIGISVVIWKKADKMFPADRYGRDPEFFLLRIFSGIVTGVSSIVMSTKVFFIVKCFVIPELIILEILQRLSNGGGL